MNFTVRPGPGTPDDYAAFLKSETKRAPLGYGIFIRYDSPTSCFLLEQEDGTLIPYHIRRDSFVDEDVACNAVPWQWHQNNIHISDASKEFCLPEHQYHLSQLEAALAAPAEDRKFRNPIADALLGLEVQPNGSAKGPHCSVIASEQNVCFARPGDDKVRVLVVSRDLSVFKIAFCSIYAGEQEHEEFARRIATEPSL